MSIKEGKIIRVSPTLYEALGKMRDKEIKQTGIPKISMLSVSEKAGKLLLNINEKDYLTIQELRRRGLRGIRI